MRYFLQEHYTGQSPKLYGPYQKKEYAVDKLLTLLSEKGDLSKEELQERYAEGSMVGQIVARGDTDDSIIFKDAFDGPLCYRIIQQDGMDKEKLKSCLEEGIPLIYLFGFSEDTFYDNQKGPLVYKGTWDLSDHIIYIPAEDSNEKPIPIDRALQKEEISAVIEECFTGEDFLAKAKGNIKLAEELFNFVSFQSPKLGFIFEYLDENEFKKKFGEPIEKFL